MPAFLLHVGATVNCPHGGQANIASVNQRVKVNGMAVAIVPDLASVAACPFQVPIGTGTKPQPCVTVKWMGPPTRVKVMGQFVLLVTSQGLCKSVEQIPQGPPIVAMTQVRVKGS